MYDCWIKVISCKVVWDGATQVCSPTHTWQGSASPLYVITSIHVATSLASECLQVVPSLSAPTPPVLFARRNLRFNSLNENIIICRADWKDKEKKISKDQNCSYSEKQCKNFSEVIYITLRWFHYASHEWNTQNRIKWISMGHSTKSCGICRDQQHRSTTYPWEPIIPKPEWKSKTCNKLCDWQWLWSTVQ